MKIIDLLNKIAKGEEVPKKIIVNSDVYERQTDSNTNEVIDYINCHDGCGSLFDFVDTYRYCFIKQQLDYEVLILVEDKEYEDIEETKNYEDFEGIDDYIEHLKDNINALIRNQKKILERLNNDK